MQQFKRHDGFTQALCPAKANPALSYALITMSGKLIGVGCISLNFVFVQLHDVFLVNFGASGCV
jgi:hypothetical protein